MVSKWYHSVLTVHKSNRKIVELAKIDTSNTHIHDHSLSLLGTGTSVESDSVKLGQWVQISPLSEMMQSCKKIVLICILKYFKNKFSKVKFLIHSVFLHRMIMKCDRDRYFSHESTCVTDIFNVRVMHLTSHDLFLMSLCEKHYAVM
jgi:hypothetical protein